MLGGDRVNEYLRAPNGTPSNYIPKTIDSAGTILWVPIPSGGGGASGFYDPETAPTGQTTPTLELDFKTITTWPSGWTTIGGTSDFLAHDINTTRPGALWARGQSADGFWRGRSTTTAIIPASTDFCCLWRPWSTAKAQNYGLTDVVFSVANDLTTNGLHCFQGYHSGYGGYSTSAERFGAGGTGNFGSWNSYVLNVGSFQRLRRVGTNMFHGISPDGSTWQEDTAVNPSTLSTAALYVMFALYSGGNPAHEGAWSVFRLWHGSGMGVAQNSGKIL